MKLNTLFVVGVCAGTLLVSCNPKTAQEHQLKYTHTSLVDGEAYQFFQLVGAKAVYENDYASYAANVASSSQAKELATKAQELYSSLIPALDSLATEKQVDFPIKKAAKFVAPGEEVVEEEEILATAEDVSEEDADSLQQVIEEVKKAPKATVSYSDEAYVHHVQQEIAVVKDQLQRMTGNTDKDIRSFAEANLEKVAELFTLAGGEEDVHAGH